MDVEGIQVFCEEGATSLEVRKAEGGWSSSVIIAPFMSIKIHCQPQPPAGLSLCSFFFFFLMTSLSSRLFAFFAFVLLPVPTNLIWHAFVCFFGLCTCTLPPSLYIIQYDMIVSFFLVFVFPTCFFFCSCFLSSSVSGALLLLLLYVQFKP